MLFISRLKSHCTFVGNRKNKICNVGVGIKLSVVIGKLRQPPQSGRLHSITSFPSAYVIPRRVDIWLPAHYENNTQHSVVYMHDGQNLFDYKDSFNGHIWAADSTLQALINEAKVRPAIIVGIWNTKLRYQEYFPVVAWEKLPDKLKRKINFTEGNMPLSDAYLNFIITELKPFIDANYAVNTKAESTFIAGSSMGGLISAYALARYPEVFGGAACMSTHWPLSEELDNKAYSKPLIDWLGKNLPNPGKHFLYFDYGTEGFDSCYGMHQDELDKHLINMGYNNGDNWITYKASGAKHHESYWRERLGLPFHFLLRNTL